MRIAFYAPMKAPTHPTPSGDRQIARLFMTALRRGGHDVALASDFRSYEGKGDAVRQQAIADQAAEIAAALIADYRRMPDRAPDLWLTYHLFHKAPDRLGPAVAAALEIPYVVAEASFAPKQARGPWSGGHKSVAGALSQAAAVIYLNPVDQACIAPLLRADAAQVHLKPFTDTGASDPDPSRATLAARWDLPMDAPWLLAVGMMRADAKRDSYVLLAAALAQVSDLPWRLMVVGDGPARTEIAGAFGSVQERVSWCGEVTPEVLPAYYAAADLLVWPAVNEALGLSILEAQAAGLPAVVGNAGAVPTIVADGETGLVVGEGDAAAFAAAVRILLADPARRAKMAAAATKKVAAEHSLAAAAGRLDEVVRNAVSSRST